MIKLENEFLKVTAEPLGAELTSVYDKVQEREVLWTADPAWWNRHAPLLFPVVGSCIGKQYRFNGKTYPMPQHGFCKDAVFAVEEKTDIKVVFVLRSSEETRKVYPFEWTLTVTYILEGNKVHTDYAVINESEEAPMYFSIGGHPGLLFDGALKDQEFRFNSKENLDRLLLNMEVGQFSRSIAKDYVVGGESIAVTEHLFDDDALVFHNFAFTAIDLVNRVTGRGARVHLQGFPYVGMWAKPGAPYACIEPWFGLADYEDFHGELPEKDGIMKLEAKGQFRCRYTIETI